MRKKNTSAKPMAETTGIKYSIAELRQQAQLVANAFALAYNRKHRLKLPLPIRIEWDLHLKAPKVAGRAHSDMHIELNVIMMQEYPHEMLNRTIPHEIAHLAEFYEDRQLRRATKDHGEVWVKFMQSMGQPILKYHGMNPAKAKAAAKMAKKS